MISQFQYHLLFIACFAFFVALKPLGRTPMFTGELEPADRFVGEKHKLVCYVTGKPEPTIEWFKDGLRLRPTRNVTESFDGETCTLTFKELELDDKGTYQCVASNELGKQSTSANLEVRKKTYKPEVLEPLKDLVVYESETAKFEIKLARNTVAEVEWYQGTNRILHTNKFNIENDGQFHSLIVKDVQRNDAGLYKCVVKNDAGKVTLRADLNVKEKQFSPRFLGDESEEPFTVEEDGKLQVKLEVEGNPKPDITWYKDDRTFMGSRRVELRPLGNTHSLVIHKATVDDAATYRCEAKNKHGTDYRIVDVRVKGMK